MIRPNKHTKILLPYINLIKDKKLRELTIITLNEAGEDLKQPSSTSGMHHPEDELREYGITVHLRKAVVVALSALRRRSPKYYEENTVDIVLTATLLHDTPFRTYYDEKAGRYRTDKDHAILNAEYVMSKGIELEIEGRILWQIVSAIASHMGRWANYDHKKYERETEYIEEYHDSWDDPLIDAVVREADYFSSRSFISVAYSVDIAESLIDGIEKEYELEKEEEKTDERWSL